MPGISLLIGLLLVTLAGHVAAQDIADPEQKQRLKSVLDKHRAKYIGMPFGEFSGTSIEGKQINNDRLRGKVSLI